MTTPEPLRQFDADVKAAILQGVEEGKPYEQVIEEVKEAFRDRYMALIRAHNEEGHDLKRP